jgi:dTDP-4-dehydrorhamnose reductase
VLPTDVHTRCVDDRDAVLTTFAAFRPELVLHGGALTGVDLCETEVDAAYAVNAVGTRHVAEAAALVGAHVVYVSTDYVFDGTAGRPYREWDTPSPTSVYGASKLAGERECRPGTTIVRTSWVCGAHGANMVVTALRLASEGDGELRFVDDQHGSPTFTADLAPAIVTLGLDRRPGIFHVTNSGATTWWGLVRAVLAEAGADPERVKPISTAELDPPRPAPRPPYSVLDNMALRVSGLPTLPDWQDGLARLVAALRSHPHKAVA